MSDTIIDEELQEASPESQQSKANPFPGLRPFKIDESHLFFGREGQSDEVLLKLSKNQGKPVIASRAKKSNLFHPMLSPNKAKALRRQALRAQKVLVRDVKACRKKREKWLREAGSA